MRTGKRVPNTEVYPGAALYKNGEEGGDSGGRGGLGRGGWIGQAVKSRYITGQIDPEWSQQRTWTEVGLH